MIQEKQKLSGTLNSKQSLNGSLSNSVIYVDPITQEKTVIPTAEQQIVTPDEEYTGLSKVTVDKIPDEYIIPTGNIEITKNGIYNVREKETANVNIPELKLGTKNITENGVYKASDDELDGYSEVNVETNGVDINDYFKPTIAAATNTQYTNGVNAIIKKIPDTITISGDSCASMFQYCTAITTIPLLDTSRVTNMSKMFYNCNSLQTIPPLNTSKVTNMRNMFNGCYSLTTIPQLDTSEVTDMLGMFNTCYSLTTIPQLNTGKVTYMSSMFRGCYSLTTIPQLDTSEVTDISNMFYLCYILSNLGGLENLGQAYSTTQSANYYNYTLDLSYATVLTEQSIINILNNLYDIKTKGCKPQQVVLGSTNLAKLKSEEGQTSLSNAQAKGWSLS